MLRAVEVGTPAKPACVHRLVWHYSQGASFRRVRTAWTAEAIIELPLERDERFAKLGSLLSLRDQRLLDPRSGIAARACRSASTRPAAHPGARPPKGGSIAPIS